MGKIKILGAVAVVLTVLIQGHASCACEQNDCSSNADLMVYASERTSARNGVDDTLVIGSIAASPPLTVTQDEVIRFIIDNASARNGFVETSAILAVLRQPRVTAVQSDALEVLVRNASDRNGLDETAVIESILRGCPWL